MNEKMLSVYSRLRILIRTIEKDIELVDYSEVELDTLAAAIDLSKGSASFRAAAIVSHPIFENSAQATIYRAIKNLERKGFLKSIDVDGKRFLSL